MRGQIGSWRLYSAPYHLWTPGMSALGKLPRVITAMGQSSLNAGDLVGVLMTVDTDEPFGVLADRVIGTVNQAHDVEIEGGSDGLTRVVELDTGQSGDGRTRADDEVGVEAGVVGGERGAARDFLNLEQRIRVDVDEQNPLGRSGPIAKRLVGDGPDADHDADDNFAGRGLTDVEIDRPGDGLRRAGQLHRITDVDCRCVASSS